MPAFTMRFGDDTDIQRLDAAAQAAGLSREEWARQVLLGASTQPTPKARYTLRGYTDGGARFTIKRIQDSVGPSLSGGASSMDGKQFDAYKLAKDLVLRNGAGDRERAIGLLSSAGFEVFEV